MSKKDLRHLIMSFITVALTAAMPVCAQEKSGNGISAIGIHTNLLTMIGQAPSIGVDIRWAGRWQAGITGSYGDWGKLTHGKDVLRLRNALTGECRYYISAMHRSPVSDGYSVTPFRGCYLGVDGTYFRYDNGCRNPCREGNGYAVGPLVGYTFNLYSDSRRTNMPLSIDIAIGAGFVHTSYNKYEWYEPKGMNMILGTDADNKFGITHAKLSLVYHFNLKTHKN